MPRRTSARFNTFQILALFGAGAMVMTFGGCTGKKGISGVKVAGQADAKSVSTFFPQDQQSWNAWSRSYAVDPIPVDSQGKVLSSNAVYSLNFDKQEDQSIYKLIHLAAEVSGTPEPDHGPRSIGYSLKPTLKIYADSAEFFPDIDQDRAKQLYDQDAKQAQQTRGMGAYFADQIPFTNSAIEKYVLYKGPLSVGNKWSYQFDSTQNVVASVKQKLDFCTPAGTVKDCYLVEHVFDGGKIVRFWIAAGIGLVRWEGVGPAITLKSFKDSSAIPSLSPCAYTVPTVSPVPSAKVVSPLPSWSPPGTTGTTTTSTSTSASSSTTTTATSSTTGSSVVTPPPILIPCNQPVPPVSAGVKYAHPSNCPTSASPASSPTSAPTASTSPSTH